MAKGKKTLSVLGVLGGAAMDLARGKPQPPLRTVVDVFKAATKKSELPSKVRGKKPAEKPVKEKVIKQAIDKGLQKAVVKKTVRTAEPVKQTSEPAPRQQLTATYLTFDHSSFDPHLKFGNAPKTTPSQPVTPSPEPVNKSTAKHPRYDEAVPFLKVMGLKDREARAALDKVQHTVPHEAPVNDLVKLALKHMKD